MTEKKNRRQSHGKNKNRSPNQHDYPTSIIGILSVHPRGFGFVQPIDLSIFPYDIFIPPSSLIGSLDGDTVEVVIGSPRSDSPSETKWKGAIKKVLKRGRSSLVGIVHGILTDNIVSICVPVLSPDKLWKARLCPDVECHPGDRIVVKNIPWETKGKRKPIVLEMVRLIGNIEDPLTDIPTIQEEFLLPSSFPDAVLNETDKFDKILIDKEIENRVDLRPLECFTIDGATAKDFDDAVSLSLDSKNNFILGVHIADVSHYVRPHTALDEEALSRGNSVYFPGTVLPMLPSALSDDLCSLVPGENRLAASVFMKFDRRGNLIEYDFCKSVINSKCRFTYDEVDEILAKQKGHQFSNTLFLMHELSKIFQKQKNKRGCLRFSLPALSIELNKQGEPVAFHVHRQTSSHQLIEEFMLKTNETVARYLTMNVPVTVYRTHEQPDELHLANFRELIRSLTSIELPEVPPTDPSYYRDLLASTASLPLADFIQAAFIKSMKTAIYSTSRDGHYGLQLQDYSHFTSPIRRYPDLIIHRLLFEPDTVDSEALEELCRHCSSKERLAAKAEYALERIKKLRFFKTLLQNDSEKLYRGLVTGLKPEGITFTLPELFYDDFIPSAALPSSLRSRRTGKHDVSGQASLLRAGDPLYVSLHTVNLYNLSVEWKIADLSLTETHKEKERKPPSSRSKKKPSKGKKKKTNT